MPIETTFQEPIRSTAIVKTADVIVCGAGPAGIGAALAAARTGARVHMPAIASPEMQLH